MYSVHNVHTCKCVLANRIIVCFLHTLLGWSWAELRGHHHRWAQRLLALCVCVCGRGGASVKQRDKHSMNTASAAFKYKNIIMYVYMDSVKRVIASVYFILT